MARRSKTEQEQGYVRNYWDEVREMEADYRGVVLCAVECGPRPGVLRFRLSFTPLLLGEDNHMGSVMYQFEFPNAGVQSFAGAFWAASLKLLALVEQSTAEHPSATGR